MTVEEKAKKYAEEAILTLHSESELMQDFVQKLKKYAKVDFLAGYNEAMRWRDPKVELPENEEIVQVKCHSNNETWYEQLRYMKAHNVWACDQTIGAKVVGWKPIE